ncbi:response regulator [Hyunsoonleella pacifica]|uniref:Response regulator n=1 Tax=Hyunsoonleella pacifica TaxID=1080224 RepID=A0A4Q9FNY5_9FLAO|nr:response regulator [Hyunsoonleella pacifica]TBN16516.1 response regulator [Hyunsoonleella pacifica]GGD18731.1 response regulator [Hyunsoonleella pacifica]
MTDKLDLIIFIDDDLATNYLHERNANLADCAKQIKVFSSALDALEYLKDTDKEDYIKPNIIFLDINMPIMNGWEFLEEYEKLNLNEKSNLLLVMLTTSLNPKDKAKADALNVVSDFRNKPLLSEHLLEIVSENFD